jgi:oxaloacetate decarboxylase beta subunit
MGFSIWDFFQGLYTFTLTEPKVAAVRFILILAGFLFVYLGYRKILEPFLIIPMGLGMLTLLLSGVGGLIGGLIYYKLSNKKVNPLLGIAGVSCVPTTAKVAQKCAVESNVFAFILPYAMGPCVAGVITTAIITGIYISGTPHLV